MAYVKRDYVQSDEVSGLQDAYNQHLQTRPGEYTSRYQDQLDQLLGSLQGRKAFSYDLGQDPLYRQYRNQYIHQGRQAMMDTIGRSSAMTGGYGNSYGQTAGQQTYQNYLQSLNDRIPELYALALEKYRMEGEDLMDRYQTLNQMEQGDYQKHRDQMADWDAQSQRLYQQYIQERDFDYGRYTDEEEYAYDRYRDEIADQQWQSAFDYQKEQNLLAYEQWLQEFEYQKQQDQLEYEQWLREFEESQRRYEQSRTSSGSRGGSGGSGSKTSSEDTLKAHTFVENMLNNATSSRFDPERVINSTNALTADQKKEAQSYLQTILEAGRMK